MECPPVLSEQSSDHVFVKPVLEMDGTVPSWTTATTMRLPSVGVPRSTLRVVPVVLVATVLVATLVGEAIR
jgi:hypothetical protein